MTWNPDGIFGSRNASVMFKMNDELHEELRSLLMKHSLTLGDAMHEICRLAIEKEQTEGGLFKSIARAVYSRRAQEYLNGDVSDRSLGKLLHDEHGRETLYDMIERGEEL